jgi:hypothetical protein
VFYWNLNNTTSNSNTNKSSQLYSLCLVGYTQEMNITQDIVSYDTKIILSNCLSRDIEKSIINKIKNNLVYTTIQKLNRERAYETIN